MRTVEHGFTSLVLSISAIPGLLIMAMFSHPWLLLVTVTAVVIDVVHDIDPYGNPKLWPWEHYAPDRHYSQFAPHVRRKKGMSL